jgi:hypothetical protein
MTKGISNKELGIKSLRLVLFAVFLYSLFVILYPAPAPAATDYQLLAPIPLEGSGCAGGAGETCKTTASPYIRGVFMLVIGLATGLAVMMIIFGGIKYMSTDAFTGKSEAKETIQNAIWGLFLIISAWLILYTINPKLVEFNLNIPIQTISSAITGGTDSSGGTPMTLEEIAAHNQIYRQLKLADVGTNAGPCLQGQGYGCTNLNGLPENTIQGLISLKNDCGCIITITGGTEPGPHTTHGVGIPVVDLSPTPSLNNYLAQTNSQATTPQNGTQVKIGSTTYTYEVVGANGRSTGDHWHVQF